MVLANAAAARIVRRMMTTELDFTTEGKQELIRWLASESWATACVEATALATELASRGVALMQESSGRLAYNEETLVGITATSAAARGYGLTESLYQSHEVLLKLGPGKVSGVQAKLLHLDGLRVRVAKWSDAAEKSLQAVFVHSLAPSIEFLEGLTLVIKVSLAGLPAQVTKYVAVLRRIAEDEIASRYSPPSCTCIPIPKAHAGFVIGKRGQHLKMIQLEHRVYLQVLKQSSHACHEEEVLLKAWMTPCSFAISGDPAKVMANLWASSLTTFERVNDEIGRLICQSKQPQQPRALDYRCCFRRPLVQDVDHFDEHPLVLPGHIFDPKRMLGEEDSSGNIQKRCRKRRTITRLSKAALADQFSSRKERTARVRARGGRHKVSDWKEDRYEATQCEW